MPTGGYTEEKLLNAGIRQGHTVAILSENSARFAEVVRACWRLGVCVTPLNRRMPTEKLKGVLAKLAIT